MSCSQYPNDLKNIDVTPVFQKDDKSDKSTYGSISILPNFSKVYQRLMQNQMCPYFRKIFSKYQCGFRKGFNRQHCFMSVIEKWCRSLDVGGHAEALLTNLSKAFDCIEHDLFITKFKDYEFDMTSLNFIYSDRTGRKQRKR